MTSYFVPKPRARSRLRKKHRAPPCARVSWVLAHQEAGSFAAEHGEAERKRD